MFLSCRSHSPRARTLWQISGCQKEWVGQGQDGRGWPVSVRMWCRLAEGDRRGCEENLHLKLRWA